MVSGSQSSSPVVAVVVEVPAAVVVGIAIHPSVVRPSAVVVAVVVVAAEHAFELVP